MDQLSFIVRYVSDKGDVIEALLDIAEVKTQKAEGIFELLTALLKKHGLSLLNARGQGYDGCATMAGTYTRVQTRVKEVTPFAYFVHCYAHRLNLVVVDVCSRNVTCRNFFGVVQKLYVFIEGSTKRHGIFQKNVHSSGCHTLRSLSTTRWSTRADNCMVILATLPSIVQTLEKIITDPFFDVDTAGDAAALLKAIDFEFCLCLVAMNKLLQLCNVLSKSLQSEDMNISAASTQMKSLMKAVQAFRSESVFENTWSETESLAESIGVEYVDGRKRKVSRKIDCNWSQEVILTGKDRFRVNFFYEVIDLMLTGLRTRFSDEVLPLLEAVHCLSSPDVAKMKEVEKLAKFYPDDVNCSLVVSEYRLFAEMNFEKCDIHAVFLNMHQRGLNSVYPNLCKLYRLVLTLPVTSASCERSFSALKFVKGHLRTVMAEQRLSDLMLIAVEAERAKICSPDRASQYFWSAFADRR